MQPERSLPDRLRYCFQRYGHVIHSLSATQSLYGNLNDTTVERDFVEAPVSLHLYFSNILFMTLSLIKARRPQSQFLERHMLQPEVLRRLAINKNGEVIPDEMIRKLQESQEIGSSMDTITQMTYARA